MAFTVARPALAALLAAVALPLAAAASSSMACASGAKSPGAPRTATAEAAKSAEPSGAGAESLAERRAVRGSPVDDRVESPELSEVRRFEEQAFPRPGVPLAPVGAPDAPGEAGPGRVGLSGQWTGSGDVPDPLQPPPQSSPSSSSSSSSGASARAPAPAPDSEWLRSLRPPELPIRWEPELLRYLDYFKNDPRGRAVMTVWLRRAGRFRASFEAAMERQGVPKDLFCVAMIESGFETGARSRVGAGGVWQFMPGAGRAYGLEVSYWVDARRDPERAVEAAARYFKDLHVRFGSWYLVLAAYNAGYGAVLRSITRYNTNDYWELIRHEAGLPWESSIYVPKILAAAVVGRNLDAFGFAGVAPDAPLAYEEVEVPPGTALATVARAASVKPEALLALNPHLVRERTPPDRGVSKVRVPVGTGPVTPSALEAARTPGDRLDTVVLRSGESLDDVARARRVSTRELKRLNGVRDTAELRAGVAILVPQSAAPGPRSRPKAASSDSDDDDRAEILVAVPDRAFSYEGRERVFYRTREGDTVDEIADALGVRGEDLVEWNNLDPGAKLHPGMVLQAFARKDLDPSRVVLLDPNKVRVVILGSQEFLELETARRGKKRLVIEARAGDTLAKLGRRYGLTPGDLARINRFSYDTDLKDGQKVVVYSPVGEEPREASRGLAPESRRAPALGPAAAPLGRPTETLGRSAEQRAAGRGAAVTKGRAPDRKTERVVAARDRDKDRAPADRRRAGAGREREREPAAPAKGAARPAAPAKKKQEPR